MAFRRIENKKKCIHVLEQVIEEIRQGNYKVGEKLLPERVIAEQIGVSRTSVREALSVLSSSGVITKRQGDGTYIQSSDEKFLSRALSITKKGEDIHDVFELQQVLEPNVAQIAAEKKDQEDVNRMIKALEKMQEAVKKLDYAKYFNADRSFHLAIANATKNPLIVEQVKSLVQYMNNKLWRAFKSYSLDSDKGEKYLSQSLKVHQQIIKAIKNGNKTQLQMVMEKHFNRVEDKLFDY